MTLRAARYSYVADECVEPAIVDYLRANGLDIDWVHDFDPRAPDSKVLEHAHERQRILLTKDYDFGELLVKERIAALGVVHFALHRLTRDARRIAVLEALNSHADQLVGNLVMVEPGRVRLRSLDK